MAGTNSLWHIDGHHILVTWGFVIHGGIYGFSCLIVFLKCSTNNRSNTVLDLFFTATQRFEWPSRVRSDHGGENVMVWEAMDERGNINSKSANRKTVERVFHVVTHIFYYTFQSMEEAGILERSNTLHLFALHFTFLPRINTALESFVEAWNLHPI